MTVSSETASITYTGDGATTAFAVPFYFLDNSHLKVVEQVIATGVETTKTITTHYTVTGAGNEAGGTVTAVTAPASTVRWTIQRNVPATQTTDFPPNDRLPAESLERAVDKLTMLVQAIKGGFGISRVLKLFDGDTDGSGRYNANSNRIAALGNGTASTDAVNLGQMEAAVAAVGGTGSGISPLEFSGTGNGATTTFTLGSTSSWTMASDQFYDAYVGGVYQNSGLWSIGISGSNRTITFNTAPANGAAVDVKLRGYSQQADSGAATLRSDLASSADAGKGDALSAVKITGTGPTGRTQHGRNDDYAHFEDFLGDGYDYAVTDASTAFVTACTWSSVNRKPVVFSGQYRIANCATVASLDNIHLVFNGATFYIRDDGTNGTLVDTNTGKIGLLFKQCDDILITGGVKLLGQGVVGTTSLMGVCFDNCDDPKVPAHFYMEKMAIGRYLSNCNSGMFGNIDTYQMYGKQTFESPPTNTAGSSEGLAGCYDCWLGHAIGRENYKPVRYASIATGSPNNEKCSFGITQGTAYPGSIESSVLSIRSAVDCLFGDIIGDGFTTGLRIRRESGDTTYSIDGNVFGNVQGEYPSTGASVDAAVLVEVDSPLTMGSNKIGDVSVTCGGEYGIRCMAGVTTFGNVTVAGSTRPFLVADGTVYAESIKVTGQAQAAITHGQSGYLFCNQIEVLSGSTGGVTAAIRYDTAFGSGGVGAFHCDRIRYRHNGVATDHTYVYMDLTNGFESTYIGDIDGTGTSAQARWVSDAYSVQDGRKLSTAAPTSGTYSVGSQVWKSNIAIAQQFGWVCTTAGTPGTWTKFGILQSVSADKGDAAATLTVGTSETTQRWATPLTADRAVTLSTTGAANGDKFLIVRTAASTGAFNLNVGTGPLKALAAGTWCMVEHNGSAWMLTAYGAL